jgi:hypothetical protein
MARIKKTDNCCRYCKHRGWGKSHRYQQYDGIVCLRRPKVFKNDADNIEPHYFATRMIDTCEDYERRTDDD